MTKEPVPLVWTLVAHITKNVITIKNLFGKKHGSPFHTRYYLYLECPDQASSKSYESYFFSNRCHVDLDILTTQTIAMPLGL